MSKRARLGIILVVLVVCGLFVYPSLKWYFMVPESSKIEASGSREDIQRIARSRASRDFEYLTETYATDPSSELPENLSYLIPLAKKEYKRIGNSVPSVWTVEAVQQAYPQRKELFKIIETYYRDELLAVKSLSNNIVQLGLDLSGGMSVLLGVDEADLAEKNAVIQAQGGTPMSLDEAVEQVMEILNSRIDQFGLTEPQIRRQGSSQISVDIPGAVNSDRVDALLLGKGSLNFHIVDSAATDNLIAYMQENANSYDASGNVYWPGLPAGRIIAGNYNKNEYGIDELNIYRPYVVLYEEVGLSGEYVESANVTTNNVGLTAVSFMLSNTGADIFYKLTSENVNEPLAVVLDGRIKQIATISGPIRDQVQVSGSFTNQEAQDLAKVLRTGALPVEVVVESQNAVGASLGAETVKQGLWAILIGLVGVILFMAIYYKGAGLIADLALVFNLVIIFSVLSALNFTLTLTSIAGLILTVGMAVDANVIIFERIKEEYRLGKSPAASVRAGYKKAFKTIADANITTFIAAIVLSMLNSGPIKGFATTLSVGIISSLFTALFVSRLLFDFFIERVKVKSLSIGWGVKK